MAKRRKKIVRQVANPPSPFNTALESGLRTLCILYAAHPRALDTQRLVFYDYLVVHSGDVDAGPKSIHPATPFRSNEWLVRRKLVADGLHLLMSRGLVSPDISSDGILYAASESAGAFLTCLSEEYTLELRNRAEWVVKRFSTINEASLLRYFRENLDRWGAEFQPVGNWEDNI